MNAETTVLVTDKSVTTAINQLIEAEKRGLRKRRDTAISLNRFYRCESIKEEGMPFAELVSGDAWFDVLVHDKSSTGKQVLGYRKSIYDALKEMKHSNPSKVWADICAYGREELGLPPKAKVVKPASEKLIKALETALKIAVEHPSPSEAEVNAVLTIQRLLGTLGADTAQ
jgi:hypothetical protein